MVHIVTKESVTMKKMSFKVRSEHLRHDLEKSNFHGGPFYVG